MSFIVFFMDAITDPPKLKKNKDAACTLKPEFALDNCKEWAPRSFNSWS